MKNTSLTTRVLLGLALGLGLGAWIAAAGSPALREAAAWVEPLGTLWTRAIQMTVIPLVTALLFTGVAAGGAGVGRVGARALLLFLVLLAGAAALTLAAAPPVLAGVGVDPAAAAALRAAAVDLASSSPRIAFACSTTRSNSTRNWSRSVTASAGKPASATLMPKVR